MVAQTAKSPKTTEAVHQTDSTSTRRVANASVKLGTNNGSACLETFLTGVKNFDTYFHLTEEDELFHLLAGLRGPAWQLFWGLGLNVTLADLTHLLCLHCGSQPGRVAVDQTAQS